MCLDILRNAPKAIADAKKQKKIGKSAQALVEAAVIFAISTGIVVFRSGSYDALLLSSVASVFVSIVVVGLLLGLVIHVATTTLGGRGKYFEGLTTVSYSLLPISVGVLVSSLLAFVPFAAGLQLVVLALAFTLGLAVLYRAIKDLYAVDMVTSLVAVSVSILALLMAVYASVGLSLLTTATGLPVA